MRVRMDVRGEYLGCLRFPDCAGRLERTPPRPEVTKENVPRAVVISPLLYLTGQALTGFLASEYRPDMTAEDIGDSVVVIAAATLNSLMRRVERNADS